MFKDTEYETAISFFFRIFSEQFFLRCKEVLFANLLAIQNKRFKCKTPCLLISMIQNKKVNRIIEKVSGYEILFFEIKYQSIKKLIML